MPVKLRKSQKHHLESLYSHKVPEGTTYVDMVNYIVRFNDIHCWLNNDVTKYYHIFRLKNMERYFVALFNLIREYKVNGGDNTDIINLYNKISKMGPDCVMSYIKEETDESEIKKLEYFFNMLHQGQSGYEITIIKNHISLLKDSEPNAKIFKDWLKIYIYENISNSSTHQNLRRLVFIIQHPELSSKLVTANELNRFFEVLDIKLSTVDYNDVYKLSHSMRNKVFLKDDLHYITGSLLVDSSSKNIQKVLSYIENIKY